jgi:vitamin B12 transporter
MGFRRSRRFHEAKMPIVHPRENQLYRPPPFDRALMCLCAAAILFPSSEAIAQAPRNEKVVVTANAYPVAFDSLARNVDVITREEILSLPVRSLAEVLDYSAGISIRSRAPFGVQADLSVSGANFQQVLVLVDGVRMNDAQTGHHNLDLPFSLEDVERIEILHGAGSALHGADAFGGIVNIITRKGGRQLNGAAAVGQFGLLEGSARLGIERADDSLSVSLFGNRSGGFMVDRDFRTAGANVRAALGTRSELSAAFVDKEF